MTQHGVTSVGDLQTIGQDGLKEMGLSLGNRNRIVLNRVDKQCITICALIRNGMYAMYFGP